MLGRLHVREANEQFFGYRSPLLFEGWSVAGLRCGNPILGPTLDDLEWALALSMEAFGAFLRQNLAAILRHPLAPEC